MRKKIISYDQLAKKALKEIALFEQGNTTLDDFKQLFADLSVEEKENFFSLTTKSIIEELFTSATDPDNYQYAHFLITLSIESLSVVVYDQSMLNTICNEPENYKKTLFFVYNQYIENLDEEAKNRVTQANLKVKNIDKDGFPIPGPYPDPTRNRYYLISNYNGYPDLSPDLTCHESLSA